MKKRILCAAMASVMVLSLAACAGGAEETTAAETAAAETTAAETTAADAPVQDADASAEAEDESVAGTSEASGEESQGGTFIVGFDQDFPPMGFIGDDGEFTGFDLSWRRRWHRAWDGNLCRSPLPGIPRIWSWSQETLTASGTDLP